CSKCDLIKEGANVTRSNADPDPEAYAKPPTPQADATAGATAAQSAAGSAGRKIGQFPTCLAEIKISTPARPALPMLLRCDHCLRFHGNANHRTGASLSRSMPRIKFAPVPSPVRLFLCRARS